MFGDSLLAQINETQVEDIPDALLEEEFSALQRLIERLEIERLRHLAEIDRRGLHQRDGHLSAVSWLASAHGVSRSSAVADVRAARSLEHMPIGRDAIARGALTAQSLKVLARARRTAPEAFATSEAALVEAAQVHTVDHLQRVVASWRQHMLEQRLETDGLEEARGLHASVTFGGMVRVDGNLDPETGESLITALRSVIDAEARVDDGDDRRTPAQRRADALGEICRGWLDRSDRPAVAGERPHVSVVVQVDDLVARRSGELETIGAVAAETVRRLACDASVMRVVMAGRSEPLDVGRRTPVVSGAIRRAVIMRDGGCRFPSCDRPHAWCDAHHVQHWADGGPTALSNLVLLCRRHHRTIHQGFGLRMEDGSPVFSRPDGTLVPDRAPPAQAA
jgi:hypothetical protein